jgi:hypothetical protein
MTLKTRDPENIVRNQNLVSTTFMAPNTGNNEEIWK